MDLGLKERVALVTGGSGGIGAAVSRALAAEGARVGVGFHDRKHEADGIVAEVEASGGTAMPVAHDLGDANSVPRTVETLIARWGRLDILVTCAWKPAGWPSPNREDIELSSSESWQEQLDLNVKGTAHAVGAVLPPMKKAGWGRIVMISSGAAEEGQPGLEAYAAAKASLHALNRSIARGLGRAGILCNVVMPGFVATNRNRQLVPQLAFDEWAACTPTGRLATTGEVGALVTFLASAANGSVTGSALRVMGGM